MTHLSENSSENVVDFPKQSDSRPISMPAERATEPQATQNESGGEPSRYTLREAARELQRVNTRQQLFNQLYIPILSGMVAHYGRTVEPESVEEVVNRFVNFSARG